jgi:hypothetical protein
MRRDLTRRAFGALCCAGLAAAAAPGLAAGGLELVMVERAGCAWCARWDAEVFPIFGKTPEAAQAPLRRHNLGDGQPKEAVAPVRFTPTFLLVREGKEIGRITGYMDDAAFWGLLGQLLQKAGQS